MGRKSVQIERRVIKPTISFLGEELIPAYNLLKSQSNMSSFLVDLLYKTEDGTLLDSSKVLALELPKDLLETIKKDPNYKNVIFKFLSDYYLRYDRKVSKEVFNTNTVDEFSIDKTSKVVSTPVVTEDSKVVESSIVNQDSKVVESSIVNEEPKEDEFIKLNTEDEIALDSSQNIISSDSSNEIINIEIPKQNKNKRRLKL